MQVRTLEDSAALGPPQLIKRGAETLAVMALSQPLIAAPRARDQGMTEHLRDQAGRARLHQIS